MRTIETKWFVFMAFSMPIIWALFDLVQGVGYTKTVQLTAMNWLMIGALYLLSDESTQK